MRVRKPSQDLIHSTEHWDTWTKEISEFLWYYEDNETCYILEGKAEVTDRHGNVISFGPGDWVEFEKGLQCTWKVMEPIRKKYLIH